MEQFVSGLIAAFSVVCAVFFLRFWRQTDDALFAALAGAFLTFAAQRVCILLTGDSVEDHVWVYGIRLLGFCIIIGGIWHKNRKRTSRPADGDGIAAARTEGN